MMLHVINALVLGILFVGSVVAPFEVKASPAVITFGGTQSALPRTAKLYVRTIDLQSGEVRDVLRTPPRAKVSILCDTTYCLAALSGNGLKRVKKGMVFQEYSGVSKGFGGKLTSIKLRTLRIASKTSTRRYVHPLRVSASPRLSGRNIRVGVPGDAFTISGTVAKENKPGGIAGSVITTLTRSPCYRSGVDFSVIETDPRILAARKREFDLIKKGFAASDPTFVDGYQPPNASVSGAVTSQGEVATASMSITNSSGQVIASSSVSVSKGGWLAAVDQAALELGSQLCDGTKVAVHRASCKLQSCTCCDRNEDECKGFRIGLELEGTAKLRVGGIVYASLPSAFLITQECGGAIPSTLIGATLACSRDSVEVNENFLWKFGVLMPKAPTCYCPASTAPESMSVVVTAMDSTKGERDDVILDSLYCTQ